MTDKKCFKCGEVKILSEFYRHSQMADGHVNKCKECNKKDVRENRNKKISYYRQYDRKRGNRLPINYAKKYREKYPKKVKATNMVNNAIRDGRLFPESCEVCGKENNVHAHHDDYSKPLNVRWMCAAHHHMWHAKHGEGKNAS